MSYKVVTREQGGHEVVVGWVPEDTVSVEGANLQETIFESQESPELDENALKVIKNNSYRSFDTHKYVNGEIIGRTSDELEASEFIDWDYNYEPFSEPPPVIPEPQSPPEKEPPPEEPPA